MIAARKLKAADDVAPDQLCFRHPERGSHLNRVRGAYVVAAALCRGERRGPSAGRPGGRNPAALADSDGRGRLGGSGMSLGTRTGPFHVLAAGRR